MADPPTTEAERQLRRLPRYATIFDELHVGELYTAGDFVTWYLKQVRLESGSLRNEPAGRPGRRSEGDLALAG